jgi:hypothetical protein
MGLEEKTISRVKQPIMRQAQLSLTRQIGWLNWPPEVEHSNN